VSIEDQIESAVTRSIERLLEPYLSRLAKPEPVVYTVTQVASVLQVSTDTVGRLVRRGILPRVPHLEGKLLIPRVAVDRLVDRAVVGPPCDRVETFERPDLSPQPTRPRRPPASDPSARRPIGPSRE
jgi:excisionase family DNA binding protein